MLSTEKFTLRDTILCCFWDLTSVVTSLQIVFSHDLLENIKNNDILRLPFATILLSKEDKEVVSIFNNNVIYRIHYNVILSETDVMQWFCFVSQNKVDVDIELAVVDPAEGPGGPAPLIIEPNCGPRDRKKPFWRPAPPLSKSLDHRAPTLSQGLGPALVRKLKHSAILIKIDLKRKDSLPPFYSQFHTRRGENMVRRGGEKGRSGVSRKWNCMMQRPLFPGIRQMDIASEQALQFGRVLAG